MKEQLWSVIDELRNEMTALSDDLFDHPEIGLQEFEAARKLPHWLEAQGFAVERGVGGMETAFRATWQKGNGGPSIGLLCEYDALKGLGHACGHHMQGPSILAAAEALKRVDLPFPYKIVVYGTPAEETEGGKILMLRHGDCFDDIDVALMMHGSGETTTDIKSLALTKLLVKYSGVAAHAALRPDKGRSALDGLILAFQGVEFLREHVKEEVKMHYTVNDCGGTGANTVPASATATFFVRSYNRVYLEEVLTRFEKVLQGAAMMTETTVSIERIKDVDNKIPALLLNDVIMDNARLCGAPVIRPPREKTGSTDLGNVMQRMPGSCIRVAFVPEGSASHSQAYLDAGKSEAAHDAVVFGAKILAATAADLITEPELMARIKTEYEERKAEQEKF